MKHQAGLDPAQIDPATQAAVLRLDPIDDREQFAALAELLSENTPLREALEKGDLPEAGRLSLRIRNLGIERFTVWAPGQAGSVLDAVHDRESAASSWTWARCRRAKNSCSWPARCWVTCGDTGKSAGRC